jgi:hypothetical protein
MPLNPYATYLGGLNPREVIAATPERLSVLARSLGREGLQRSPAPGKWSPCEILCHLADCELVFAFRLRQGVAEENPEVQPFDQDRWAKTYRAYSASQALGTFEAMRRWNLSFLDSLPGEAFSRKLTHPERGEMVLNTIVETMAGHDLNHLRQLEGIAGQQG